MEQAKELDKLTIISAAIIRNGDLENEDSRLLTYANKADDLGKLKKGILKRTRSFLQSNGVSQANLHEEAEKFLNNLGIKPPDGFGETAMKTNVFSLSLSLLHDNICSTFHYCKISAKQTGGAVTTNQLYQNARLSADMLQHFCEANFLVLNASKSVLVQFRGRKQNEYPQINLAGQIIPCAEQAKFLGLHVRQDCKWDDHAQYVSGRLHTTVTMLNGLKGNVDEKSLINVYYAHANSIMSYGIVIWGASDGALRTVFVAQKRLIRALAGERKFGYKVTEIYEIWHYEKTTKYKKDEGEGLFTSFVNAFLKLKQEASGWPENKMSNEDKKKYIESYAVEENIDLDESKIEKNEVIRTVAKLCLNSLWGKFGQNGRQKLPSPYRKSTGRDWMRKARRSQTLTEEGPYKNPDERQNEEKWVTRAYQVGRRESTL
ncbi:Hypothetical predicted protein [Cloeon dipterum]|uniref:DNA-directed DNA polymerase n=1 Tax=Cloeon dipterum TaxID=197152 RepID=A0A8S1CSM3_9INSE|nr:Hypothetical predicted protein [Cloeon dipterum]